MYTRGWACLGEVPEANINMAVTDRSLLDAHLGSWELTIRRRAIGGGDVHSIKLISRKPLRQHLAEKSDGVVPQSDESSPEADDGLPIRRQTRTMNRKSPGASSIPTKLHSHTKTPQPYQQDQSTVNQQGSGYISGPELTRLIVRAGTLVRAKHMHIGGDWEETPSHQELLSVQLRLTHYFLQTAHCQGVAQTVNAAVTRGTHRAELRALSGNAT